MIILEDLTNQCLADIGHLLVPIDVFGLTWVQVERILLTSVSKYAEYRPLVKREQVTILSTSSGVLLPTARKVISIRPLVDNISEYPQKLPKKDWEFDPLTKKLTTVYNGSFLVEYHSNYTVETNKLISYNTSELYPTEDIISIPLLSTPKKGTLNLTLNELDYGVEIITIDPVNDTISINTSSALYTQLLSGSLVKFSTNGTLPPQLDSVTEYYLKKNINDTFKVYTDYNSVYNNELQLTTDYLSSSINFTVLDHGFVNNQPIQLYSEGVLPTPLQPSTTYYVNVVDSNTINLKTNILGSPINIVNNGVSTHIIEYGFVDFNSIGVSDQFVYKSSYTMKDDISTYTGETRLDPEYVQLNGSLGDGLLGFTNTTALIDSTVYNLSSLELLIYNVKSKFVDPSSINISFVTKYKVIKELTYDDIIFVNIFKSSLMKSLGTSKSITKLDGLPFDVSLDELYSKGEDLYNTTMEELKNSRGYWWTWG